MKRKALLACVVAFVCAAVLAPTASAQAPANVIPITGSATNAAGQLVNFAGTFTVQRFVNQGGNLAAVGTLTGTLTNTVTGATRTVNRTVTLPVQATGSCEILDLVLGPLDLNLLGLVVHLDTVHLNITAQSGPGNLLGNLLCAVAGLLDNTGAPGGLLAGLLNQILAILP
jgi:hypothetical protein